MRAPDFWRAGRADWRSHVLAPAAALYAWSTARRLRLGTPWQAPMPVVSVGNLVAGGAGKTPLVLDLADRLRAAGRTPAVVLRGYGGNIAGPVRVDPARHDAATVGDESLLHAAATPTWVSADRRPGVEAAIADGADVVLLDDAHQNPQVAAALRLVVVDGGYGFGNGLVVPAGPLREPVETGLARADAVVLIGPDETNVRSLVADALPVLRADVVPVADWTGRKVVAFAGIGRPEKVFDTLCRAGAELVEARAFADHHRYTNADIAPLVDRARGLGAALVTTTKDRVRLPGPVRDAVEAIEIRLDWQDAGMLRALLDEGA